MISISVVHWLMAENGWTFADGPGVLPDTIHGARSLHEVYTRAQPKYTGRVTVPVLWDKSTDTVVNNESSEIIRMFNSAFDACGAAPGDYYPEELRPDIEAWNARIYDTVNNGVYKAGFATSQDAYESAFRELFDTLDVLDEHLGRHRYLLGQRLTEADWRFADASSWRNPSEHRKFESLKSPPVGTALALRRTPLRSRSCARY
jgi:glutathionyl-hydroquinone reductase